MPMVRVRSFRKMCDSVPSCAATEAVTTRGIERAVGMMVGGVTGSSPSGGGCASPATILGAHRRAVRLRMRRLWRQRGPPLTPPPRRVWCLAPTAGPSHRPNAASRPSTWPGRGCETKGGAGRAWQTGGDRRRGRGGQRGHERALPVLVTFWRRGGTGSCRAGDGLGSAPLGTRPRRRLAAAPFRRALLGWGLPPPSGVSRKRLFFCSSAVPTSPPPSVEEQVHSSEEVDSADRLAAPRQRGCPTTAG